MSYVILVTGCNGDIGTSIGRILKDCYPKFKILGSDISIDGAGQFIFDSVGVLPKANSGYYFEELVKLIEANSVDIVIPVSEAEIRLFHKHGYSHDFNDTPLVLTNAKTLEVGFDKLKTSRYLSCINMPHPWTLPVSEYPESFPCIIKNRGISGKGGVDVVDQDSVEYFRRKRPDDIWQEYLEGDEYTCGLYGNGEGVTHSIIFKRKLSNATYGFTVSGEVVEDQAIENILKKVSYSLKLNGSCNIQLRMNKNDPIIFEINPRFSSTVMFRHKLGFRDVLWSCNSILGEVSDPYSPPRPGVRFYKGYTEYFDS